ncbi:secreted immunoglobulin domain 1 [Chaetodon trifascialis]|uniref:secreted immunoglobulin domain 1 n=1 Tax=Chaetodon trifascialis TaxID=109706 RepID=UPI0039946800
MADAGKTDVWNHFRFKRTKDKELDKTKVDCKMARGFWQEQRAAATAAAPPAFTVQVRVGEDATLRCPLLDAAGAAAASTLSWYRKSAGQGPQLLLSLRSTGSRRVTYGSAVDPQKVLAAADGSLLLRGAERDDSAVYYCGVSHGDADRKRR